MDIKEVEMDYEVIFKDAGAPKRIEGASNMYTKGDFCCFRVGQMIIKYPMIHIFSVCHLHADHMGSGKSIKEHREKT